MRFNVHVERLRLQLAVRGVVHARNRLRRAQMVQVLRQLAELSPGALLLADLLLALHVLVVGVQHFAHLLVLVLNVLEVLLPREEVMLVLARVVPAIATQHQPR